MHAAFHIRVATLQDGDALAELGPRTFREAFGDLLPAAVITERMAIAYAPAQLASDLADSRQAWFVAEVEGQLVGFLALREGEPPACVRNPHPLELQRLYVDQTWHGRGPGLALLMAALKEARARLAQSVWLQAWEQNPRALAFYRKQGFEPVGIKVIELAGTELPHSVMAKSI